MRLTLTIRKTMPNVNGSYSVKVRISHNGVASYITTLYKIKSINEWDGEKICNRSDAVYLNKKLLDFLHLCEEAAIRIDYNNMSMPQIRKNIARQVTENLRYKERTQGCRCDELTVLAPKFSDKL